MLLHLMHHLRYFIHLSPLCLHSFSQIPSCPHSSNMPAHTFLLGGLCFCNGLGSGCPESLQHSFMPVENTHNLLGSYKNSSSPISLENTSYFPFWKSMTFEDSSTIPGSTVMLITVTSSKEFPGELLLDGMQGRMLSSIRLLMLLVPWS